MKKNSSGKAFRQCIFVVAVLPYNAPARTGVPGAEKAKILYLATAEFSHLGLKVRRAWDCG